MAPFTGTSQPWLQHGETLPQKITVGLNCAGAQKYGVFKLSPVSDKTLKGGATWLADSLDTDRVKEGGRQLPETKEK